MRSPVTIYKQIITKSGDKFSFSVEPLITKTWKDKFYLFPIQEKEMTKARCWNKIRAGVSKSKKT